MEPKDEGVGSNYPNFPEVHVQFSMLKLASVRVTVRQYNGWVWRMLMDKNEDSSDKYDGDFLYTSISIIQAFPLCKQQLPQQLRPSCWGECGKQLQKFHYRQQPKLWEAWQSCRRHGHTCALAAWMGQSVTNGPGEGDRGFWLWNATGHLTSPNPTRPYPVDWLNSLRKTTVPRLHIFTTAASFVLRATGPPKATAPSSPSTRLAAKRERSGGSKAVPWYGGTGKPMATTRKFGDTGRRRLVGRWYESCTSVKAPGLQGWEKDRKKVWAVNQTWTFFDSSGACHPPALAESRLHGLVPWGNCLQFSQRPSNIDNMRSSVSWGGKTWEKVKNEFWIQPSQSSNPSFHLPMTSPCFPANYSARAAHCVPPSVSLPRSISVPLTLLQPMVHCETPAAHPRFLAVASDPLRWCPAWYRCIPPLDLSAVQSAIQPAVGETREHPRETCPGASSTSLVAQLGNTNIYQIFISRVIGIHFISSICVRIPIFCCFGFWEPLQAKWDDSFLVLQIWVEENQRCVSNSFMCFKIVFPCPASVPSTWITLHLLAA